MWTIQKIANCYVNEKDLRPKSQVNYLVIARLCVEGSGCHVFEDLDEIKVMAWRRKLLDRNISKNTWNTYLRHIKILANYGRKKGWVKKHIDFGEFFLRTADKKPKTVSSKQIKQALSVTKAGNSGSAPHWFWCMVLRTLYYTAMRRRQLIGLTWQDIDLEKETITLTAEFSKTQREWKIPAAKTVVRDLKFLYKLSLKFYNEEELESKQVFNISLFNPRVKADSLTVEAVSRYFARLSVKCNFLISAHRLRHTTATKLAELGKYSELCNLLGHTRISTTMKYVHPNMNRIRDLVDTLGDLD